MMPRMSGFEVCQKIKANPDTRDTAIIMVTALNEVPDYERAVESGTDDFLSKPVNKLELITRVRSLLRVTLLRKRLADLLKDRRTRRRAERGDAGRRPTITHEDRPASSSDAGRLVRFGGCRPTRWMIDHPALRTSIAGESAGRRQRLWPPRGSCPWSR